MYYFLAAVFFLGVYFFFGAGFFLGAAFFLGAGFFLGAFFFAIILPFSCVSLLFLYNRKNMKKYIQNLNINI
ncbi:MAG: hypothetical protein ACFFFB_14505 [Candidatus Heimdallarchaeota archaeon]